MHVTAVFLLLYFVSWINWAQVKVKMTPLGCTLSSSHLHYLSNAQSEMYACSAWLIVRLISALYRMHVIVLLTLHCTHLVDTFVQSDLQEVCSTFPWWARLNKNSKCIPPKQTITLINDQVTNVVLSPIIKGYFSYLVLHFHKVGELARDR